MDQGEKPEAGIKREGDKKMSKEMFRKTRIEIGDYEFLFEEVDAQAYLYAIKDGDEFDFIMFVTAVKKGSGDTVAQYEKTWKTANRSAIQQFIDKFCQNAKFRVTWQTGGERIDAVLDRPDFLIHPRCAQAIVRLNSKKANQLHFKNFLALKTYGQDKVSRMKLETLKDLLPESQLAELTAEIGEARALQILRWIKRGLNPDHAIRKVKVDMEVAVNARL